MQGPLRTHLCPPVPFSYSHSSFAFPCFSLHSVLILLTFPHHSAFVHNVPSVCNALPIPPPFFRERERERARASLSWRKGEKEKENLKQAPRSAQSLTQGSILWPWDHDLSWNQELDTEPTEPLRLPFLNFIWERERETILFYLPLNSFSPQFRQDILGSFL